MYGVIVCSYCRKARAVNLTQKTSTCECGSRIAIYQRKVFFRSHSQREAAQAVRRMNELLAGAPASDQEDIRVTPERKEDLESSLFSFFTGEERSRGELKTLLKKLGVEDPDRMIEELLRSGMIFEPRRDHFRLV
ncbi:MAG: hypothetical protein ACE5QW_04725 [Thermoplasmata archaeon]